MGTVEDVSLSSSYTTRLLVNVDTVNGTHRNYKFYAYAKRTDASGVIEGTKISFTARLEGFSSESETNNIAKGINAYASDVENLTIIKYTGGNLNSKFHKAREYLTRYIIMKSDKDTGAIVSALLLGEKDYLPDQLRLDFRRIGISHILALSGMHLAVLSLGIEKALSAFAIKKKTRVLATSIFVLLYMALTGFSISVVRAGLMLLLSRSKDSLTSLAVAVTLICLIEPYAIFSVSLQLSALATFGIISMSEFAPYFKKPKTVTGKVFSYIGIGLLASIFAISATMAVSVFTFGITSILAPIATIVFSIFAELIMYLGCLLILLGWILPIGIILRPICFIMKCLAGALSSIKFAYVSSNFPIVMISILVFTVIFYLFIIIPLRKPIRVLNAFVIIFCIITLMPFVATANESKNETVAYYSDNKCDQMLIRSENQVCLINSSQYDKNLAYTTLDFLEETNVTHLDKYYLTHYSWSIDDELSVLLSNVSVGKIYIPSPRNEDESTILKLIKKAVEDHRTKVVVFKPYETISHGEYTINLLYSAPYGETSINAFVVAKKDITYTYISSGLLTSTNKELFYNYISLSDYLILGEHGKKYKDKLYLDECYQNLSGIIIHSDNVFLKQENMKFLSERGCKIYSHPKEIIYLE